MGKNQSASNLPNIIKQSSDGSIAFMHDNTMLMQISASGAITTTGVISGSNALSASYAATASFVTLAQTASFVTTAQTASFVANAQSASNAVAAQTASYADALTVAGTLTAQTLVVQTITSSVDFVTGSTRFGSLSSNTHVFSGSVTMNPGGLFVSSSGRIGIGNTNPTETLFLQDPNRNPTIGITHAGGGSYFMKFQQFSGWNQLMTFTSAASYMGINTSGPLILNESGSNVGIGTTNPSTLLQVSPGSSYANHPTIQVVSSYADGYDARLSLSNTHTGGRNWQLLSTNNSQGNFGGGKLIFQDATAGATTYIMALTGSNVGIGTIIPSALLQVGTNSTGQSSGDNSTLVRFGSGSAGGRVYPLTLANTATPTTGNESALSFVVGSNYSSTAIITAINRNSSTALTDLSFTTYDGGLNERMRITGAGRVGIGSTNPSTYALEVNGAVSATSGFIGNASTSTRPAATATRSGNFSSGTANGTENVDISSYYLPYFGPVWFYFNVAYNGNGAIQANWLGLADAHYFNNGTANIIWTDDGVTGAASMPSISVSVQGSTYTTRYLRVTFTATGGYAPNNWNWTFGAWNAFP